VKVNVFAYLYMWEGWFVCVILTRTYYCTNQHIQGFINGDRGTCLPLKRELKCTTQKVVGVSVGCMSCFPPSQTIFSR